MVEYIRKPDGITKFSFLLEPTKIPVVSNIKVKLYIQPEFVEFNTRQNSISGVCSWLHKARDRLNETCGDTRLSRI